MSNENKYNDKEYMFIVNDIVEHKEFSKTKNIIHHGLNRFDHCMRVSYYSYKISKFLKLDYEDVARAGLLHDFFYDNNQNTPSGIGRIDTLINHPKHALSNSKKYFELTAKEEDIITSHMFPISLKAPKYLESWLVDAVDNVVAVTEAFHSTTKHCSVAFTFLLVILVNYIR